MEDLKLKHITGIIKMSGRICIVEDDFGNSFCPSISDFLSYAESYVVGIYAENDILNVHIRHQM